jgi:predicted nucleic acid-binding protein
MIHVLDSGPLGLLSNPLANPDAMRCHAWLDRLTDNGHRVVMSEICDFEVRRELIRARLAQSIDRLDHLMMQFDALPINRRTMIRAAELWAEARRRGRPTADPAALDADVIIAAQAQLFAEATREPVVVVTMNARHLAQFVDARRWQEIEP